MLLMVAFDRGIERRSRADIRLDSIFLYFQNKIRVPLTYVVFAICGVVGSCIEGKQIWLNPFF